MKKLVLTTAIVLSMGLGALAQQGDGALLRATSRQTREDITTPSIPTIHGYDQDVPSDAPLGGGLLLLAGMGAAYLVGKRRK